MTLEQICNAAAEAQNEETAEGLLDCIIVLRGHEAPGDLEPGWFYDGALPPERLSRYTEFHAAYMQLDCIGHIPLTVLRLHSTKEELVAALLGPAGVFNPFTSVAVAFIHGRLAPFVCYYRTIDGKEHAYSWNPEIGFEYEFEERRLEWLPQGNV